MKQSAGILLYRKNKDVEVLLVHPGGPFWARKDNGAWSIPKGECEPDEDALTAAKREYKEEIGSDAPQGELIDLGECKVSSAKVVRTWAVEGNLDPKQVKSNEFEMEWPPKSGQTQQFPEVDKAAWFPLHTAMKKLVKGQTPILQKLAEHFDFDLTEHVKHAQDHKAGPEESDQTALF